MTTLDLTLLRTLPRAAADLLRPDGMWTQGTEIDNNGAMCLTGALIRACTVPGDGHIARAVYRRWDRGEDWNDADDRRKAEVLSVLGLEIGEADLAATFGPQWEPIVALVRRAASITDDEAERLGAARDAATAVMAATDAVRVAAAWGAATNEAWGAATDAVRVAARSAAWSAVRDAATAWEAGGAARGAAWGAAWALAVRDLISDDGFTQAHYDTLTRPWAQVIGPVHPDDEVRT